MKRIGILRIVVFTAALLFTVSLGDTLSAQGKKEKGEKGKGKGKKTEQQVKETTDTTRAKSGDSHKGKGKKSQSEKSTYKPRHLKENEKAEWEGGAPPGWQKGKKTGWSGSGAPPGKTEKNGEHGGEIERQYPRGSEDWDSGKKERWEKDLEKAKKRIRERVRDREGTTEKDEESASRSVDGASREGVPVEEAESAVGKAIERGMKGEEIEKMTRAMAYGSENEVDQKKLGSFVDEQIESGRHGDDLALSIYKEVDSGRLEGEEKKEAEEKKPWWKRIFQRD